MPDAEYEAKWGKGPHYAVDAVVWCRDHLLAIRRGDNGKWALPGGFVDSKETFLQAMVREVQEETTLDLWPILRDRYKSPFTRIYKEFTQDKIDRDPRSRVISEVFCIHIAWYCIDMPIIIGQDDAVMAAWLPIHRIKEIQQDNGWYADHHDSIIKSIAF